MNEPDCELSAIVILTERTTSQVSVNAPGFDLSAGPLRPSMCNSDLSVCPVPVHEFNIELSVCPTTLKEANTEFVSLSVTTQKPAFEPLNPPVMSPETTNAFYYGLSVCPVTVTGPDHEQLVNPASITELSAHSVVTRETINAIIVFPASVLEDMSTPVSCVPVSAPFAPPWRFSALSAPHWWAPALSAPPWRSAVWLWWSSAPPWWHSVLLW